MPKKEALSDEELAVIIRGQEAAAYSFSQSEIVKDRAKALDYYLGKPFGNEVEGRSQVVSTDVFDTVEGMLPSLLEIFTASNRIAECEAYGIEDEAEAKQQTEAANYILFKQNNAPLIFYTWFKDALLSKNGVVKYYYDDQKDEYRVETYENLTEEEFNNLAAQEHVEVKKAEQSQLMIGPQPVVVFNVDVKVYTKRGKVKICNVPPENFYVTPRQSSLDMNDCEFCCHKEQKTITDLKEMGFEDKDLENLHDDGEEISEESIARNFLSHDKDSAHGDPSMRQIWVSDCWILIDQDGDGVAELRHVIVAGGKVLKNEITDHVPFAVISPILFPHQFYGLSAADITFDVQLNKSVIHRQMLDNLYLSNNPRNAVVEDQVNLDDLLTSRPGGIVRVRNPQAIVPLVTPFIAKDSFPMLEYWEGVKENRTGVTRYNQGLDADSLNKTAHGISQIMTAAMKRQQLMARLFAETGVKALVKGVLHCLSTSGMKALIVRLTNGYVNIDPRQWKHQYDVTINVALGSGAKEREIAMLGMLSAKQMELIQTGRGYMVSEDNAYNMCVKLSEATGFRNPGLFFTDPKAVPPQAKVPPPNPDMVKLETDTKLKVADMQVTTQQKDKDMANERAIEEMKAKMASQTELAVANIKAQTDIAIAELKAKVDTQLKAADLASEGEDRKTDAELEVFKTMHHRTVPDNYLQNVNDSATTLATAMDQILSRLDQIGDKIVGGVQQALESNKVKSTAVKRDKSGKILSTVKEYADGRTEEVPHGTIQ